MALEDLIPQGFGDAANNVLHSAFLSMLSSPGDAPFRGMPDILNNLQRNQIRGSNQAALKQILVQAGIPEPQADIYSRDETSAKLALQQLELTKKDKHSAAVSAALGGGAPAMVPNAPAGPAAGASMTGTGGDIENRFIGTLKEGGLTNPYGLAAVAAYGNAESRYSPQNVNRTWSDPSESGQAGTSGGIMSWRADRLANMQAATRGAEDPVVAQAQFLLKENPALTQALQNAKSPQEAHRLMAEAWKFAGWDRDSAESRSRLNSTLAYSQRFLQGTNPPVQVADASGGIGPSAPVERTPLPPPAGARGNVVTAMNEREVQAQEARMAGYPTSIYGVTPETQRPQMAGAAPVVAPGIRPVGNAIPLPGGGQAEYQSVPSAPDVPPAPAASPGAARAEEDMRRNRANLYRQQEEAARRQVAQLEALMANRNTEPEQKAALQRRIDTIMEPFKLTEFDRKIMAATGAQKGTPEFEAAAQRLAFGDQNKLVREAEERELIADKLGLPKGSQQRIGYVATGTLPKETQQALTPGDKKAIREIENEVPLFNNALGALQRAKELNHQTLTGYTAKQRANIATSLPPGMMYNKEVLARAENTREFNNIMQLEAIKQMSDTLKGATTDREMDRFIEIMGDPTSPPALRERLLDRMIKLAEERKQTKIDQLQELRTGTEQEGQVRARGGSGPGLSRNGPSAPQAPGPAAGGVDPALEAELRRRRIIP